MRHVVAVAVVVLLVPSACLGQSGNRFELDVAALHVAHREAVASPLRYSGIGPEFSMAYGRLTPKRAVRVGVSVALPTLESRISSDGLPRQDLWRARLEVSALSANADPGRLVFGPRLSADLAFRDYHPSGNEATDFGYAFLHAGLGATIARTTRVRSGTLGYSLSAPLAGLVLRPYTDIRIIPRQRARVRFVTPATLPSADISIFYALPSRGRADWRLAHRVYIARYGRHVPYRALENSLGLRVGFGRGHGD